MRTDERLDERTRLCGREFASHGCRELGDVVVERGRHVQQAAVGALQMPEMKGALLLSGELFRQHGVDGPPNDARLDLCAGVDADHRDAVEHRVVVVGARVGVDRIRPTARPDADRLVRRWVEIAPLRGVLRMGPDQNCGVAHRGIGRPADRLDPSAHEAHFIRRDELRRAEVQQHRPIGRDTYLLTEGGTVARRPLDEPVVEGLGASDADP